MDGLQNQLEETNRYLKNILVFLMCREGFDDAGIRRVVGKIDNNAIRSIKKGFKKIKNDK